MSKSIKFILAAVLLACIAALGSQHVAWAKVVGPGTGTVPGCPTSASETNNGTMTTCSTSVDVKANIPQGGVATITETNLGGFSPLPGGTQGDTGIGVTVAVFDKNKNPVNALVEICFPDPSASGFVYRWVSSSEWMSWYHVSQPGSWVLFPTFHKKGLTCTKSWVGGTFATH